MIFTNTYNSPLGVIHMTCDGTCLTGLWFEASKQAKKQTSLMIEEPSPVLDLTKEWLDQYFQGHNPSFLPPMRVENLTPFRSMVIERLMKIPYGHVITYNDIAKDIAKERGIPKMSSQAVGGAVGWNPICILIPCHRVVGSNGSLTGYGGGIQNKVRLLEIEKVDMKNLFIPKKAGTAL